MSTKAERARRKAKVAEKEMFDSIVAAFQRMMAADISISYRPGTEHVELRVKGRLGELLDKNNQHLWINVVTTVEEYGFDSPEADVAREALREGVEAQLGEMYEQTNDFTTKNGPGCEESAEAAKRFCVRGAELLQLAGIPDMIFYHVGTGSCRLTDQGEVLPVDNSSMAAVQ